jgi:hypothetical protein
MTSGENPRILRLRPHHIFCDRFLPLDNIIRGEEFASTVNKIKELTRSESDLIITITEGPDLLCNSCPDYKNNRCENPIGNEEKVRRWDSKILKGFDISYNEEITVKALLARIKEKAPLDFCQIHCPWKAVCGVFNDIRNL